MLSQRNGTILLNKIPRKKWENELNTYLAYHFVKIVQTMIVLTYADWNPPLGIKVYDKIALNIEQIVDVNKMKILL